MELLNELGKSDRKIPNGLAVEREALETAVLVLSPIVPHVCSALWQELGLGDNLLNAPWPQVDKSALVKTTIQLAVQVNGKLRAQIDVPADASKEDIELVAQDNENVQRFTEGLTIRKVIVVPSKLVNIVAN